MATALIRVAAVLLLGVTLYRACGWSDSGPSAAPQDSWSDQQAARPLELEDDAEEPQRIELTNFVVAYVRYPEHTFVITDRECGNQELLIDGVTHRGGYFALAPDGSVVPVSGKNSLELFRDAINVREEGVPGDE